MKQCNKCFLEKDESLFNKQASNKDGYKNICRECSLLEHKNYYKNNKEIICNKSSKWRTDNPEKIKQIRQTWKSNNPIKVKYGKFKNYWPRKSEDEIKQIYDQMLLEQNNNCKICKKSKPLCVDHCHKTGKVRGLLCQDCNLGLGRFADSIENLNLAIDYLKETNEN